MSVEFVLEDDSAVVVFVSVISSFDSFGSFSSKILAGAGVFELSKDFGVCGALSALDVGGGDGVGRRLEEEMLGEADVL